MTATSMPTVALACLAACAGASGPAPPRAVASPSAPHAVAEPLAASPTASLPRDAGAPTDSSMNPAQPDPDEVAVALAIAQMADLFASAASLDDLLTRLDAKIDGVAEEEIRLNVAGTPWLRSMEIWHTGKGVEAVVLGLAGSVSAGALEPHFGPFDVLPGEFGEPWSAISRDRERGGAFLVSIILGVTDGRGGPVASMRGKEIVLRREPKP